MRRVLSKNPGINIVVIVPTNALKQQWEESLDKSNIKSDFNVNLDVLVINTAIKGHFKCDFLILDEWYLSR